MKKPLSLFFIFLIVTSLTLAAMKRISWGLFYFVAVLSAIVAWKIIPRLK